jgi:hypothetical protein
MGGIADDFRDGDGVRSFIFSRELAEVYLLLDFISGRSQKNLAEALGVKGDDAKDELASQPLRDNLQKICEIAWPPDTSTPVSSEERAKQAVTLLLAKDRLNAAAAPATGASIVFTLMVAGDDEPIASHDRPRGLLGRLGLQTIGADSGRSGEGNTPTRNAAGVGGGGGGGGPGGSDGGIFDRHPPSRISLATLAYPGLVRSARRFKVRFNLLLLLLFAFLIFTCALSWHIAAGRSILARLDSIEATRVTIEKRIADTESLKVPPPPPPATKDEAPPAAAKQKKGAPAPAATKQAAAPAAITVKHYCSENSDSKPTEEFTDFTQRQICDQKYENSISYKNAREDIADWIATWQWLKDFSHYLCGADRCLKDKGVALPPEVVNHQQWASVVVDVLATAVLPLCYGFLGAGASVVRGIWGKMRDSQLSPRDLNLSLGQLALGAVIGACIGLFVTPSGGGPQGAGIVPTTVSLTPSALSFIAGLGVDSVFVALDNLIKRVFNNTDQARPAAADRKANA